MLKNNNIKITDIRKTKKGFNALFCEDEFLFSVDDLLLVQYKIQIGSCFTQQELSLLFQKGQTQKALQKAYNFLSFRSHSKKELYDKLLKNFDPDCAELACEKLADMQLLDDEKFCRLKTDYLINTKKMSLSHTKLKLLTLGIDKDIIESCMQEYDIATQDENIEKLLLSKYNSKLAQPQKIIASLMRKGFGYYDIKAAFERLEIDI